MWCDQFVPWDYPEYYGYVLPTKLKNESTFIIEVGGMCFLDVGGKHTNAMLE
jgi:hypothetical protein